MNSTFLKTARLWLLATDLTERLHAVAQLAARIYIARVFFLSGLTKIRDWGSTVALFSDEYMVPGLPPEIAAYLSTGAELLLPVLLVLGLGGRFAAVGLFVLNIVAAISFSGIAEAALQQHLFWGCMLAFLALWGPGNYSIDRFIAARLRAATDTPAPGTLRTQRIAA